MLSSQVHPYSQPRWKWSFLFLILTAFATSSSGDCKLGSSVGGLPQPISLHDTAAVFAPAAASQDPSVLAQIANTLALYPFAIDGKNFPLLRKVFFPDAVANYSAPLGVLTPLKTIEATLEASLSPVTTQHALSTLSIDLLRRGCTARSTTYYTASHFGKNKYEGQVVYAYGQYQDTWSKDRDGTWKIQFRNLVYMVRSLLPSNMSRIGSHDDERGLVDSF